MRNYVVALVVFILGMVITFEVYRFYQKEMNHKTEADFYRVADLRLYLIKDILLEYLQSIESIKEFYLNSNSITETNFNNYVRFVMNKFPNCLAIGLLQEKLSEGRSKDKELIFSNSAKMQSVPFTFLQISQYHPNFIVSFDDHATFMEKLEKSQFYPGISCIDDITFFENIKKEGFFLFLPLLNKKKQLLGTLVALSNYEDILKIMRTQVNIKEIEVLIYNITQPHSIQLWDESTKKKNKTNKEWKRSLIINVGNCIWRIEAIPSKTFFETHPTAVVPYWSVPLIGFFFSLLMSAYIFQLINRRMMIEKEVKDQTNDLATINAMLQTEIQERHKIEESFWSKQNYLQKRHDAITYLTKQKIEDLEFAIHKVIYRTAQVMQVDRIGVWLYENHKDIESLHCMGLYTLSTNSYSNQVQLNSLHYPRYFKALSKHTSLILPSPDNQPLNQELSSYLAPFHINTKLDIPIIFEGILLGILSCEETRTYRNWVLEDRHFGQTVADIIALMIEQFEKVKAEKALKESEEELRFIRQNSIDGIISINEKGLIITWNYGSQLMFGYQETEIVGQPLNNIIPKNDFLKNIGSTKQLIEVKGKHKDGHVFPVEITKTRWVSDEKTFDTIIVRDITSRKDYERRLINAMREANIANAAKSQFLATISHELRTPLNAIIGFTETLLLGMDGELNQTQLESLKRIEKSSFHLLNLINDILDWSRIEANKMELQLNSENIVEVISSCIEQMQPLAKQKNIPIRFDQTKSEIYIQIDPKRIKQVLLNLLSNAIKFTEKGNINIEIVDNEKELLIKVNDTGIGLTDEEIEKIFRPFSQVDSSFTRKYGGSGLGLVISKNIINLHKGNITVESQKGKGSTFTIVLPKR